MKSYISYLCFCAFCLAWLACGEDRTHEYEERTERDHWILNEIKEKYLWAQNINEENIKWQMFFDEPVTFFNKVMLMANKDDVWSWCSVDTIADDHFKRGFFNHLDSYGMDFILMTDPTGATSRQYARVITVIPGSPADRAGLERGCFIASVDGLKLSSSNVDKLINGGERTLEIANIEISEDGVEYEWQNEHTLKMEHSEYVEDVPFLVEKIFNLNGNKVAYLMCNRLTQGPVEKDPTDAIYKSQLVEIMRRLKTDNPDVLILDLRLCNNGDLDMARLMASYVMPAGMAKGAFAKTEYATNRQSENSVVEFDDNALANSLNPSQIIVVTSQFTKGPAEWLIRALAANDDDGDLFLIGMPTAGQIVMTEEIKSDYETTLHPAVAFVNDNNDSHDFENGVQPDYEIDERMALKLFPYGDENELILNFLLDELRK